MKIIYIKTLLLLLFAFNKSLFYGQSQQKGTITGNLYLDNSWNAEIYLSYIPSYEGMYNMSNDMIVAKTSIDSLGYFEFDTNLLLPEKKLYRLHIIKKGDSPASLIIGGRNENHLFLIANRFSKITVSSHFSYPPFKNVKFKNSIENTSFQQISTILFKADSSYSESSAAKRMMIEEKLEKDLLRVADSSKFALVSLYAMYESNFKTNYTLNPTFYNTYFKKWNNNTYLKPLKDQLHIKTDNHFFLSSIIGFILIIIVLLFFYWKKTLSQSKNLTKLSVQERKIFELLRNGSTNQEISNQCLISISTVKSHVSNIYSKLKVNSRKEIMNLKL